MDKFNGKYKEILASSKVNGSSLRNNLRVSQKTMFLL